MGMGLQKGNYNEKGCLRSHRQTESNFFPSLLKNWVFAQSAIVIVILWAVWVRLGLCVAVVGRGAFGAGSGFCVG